MKESKFPVVIATLGGSGTRLYPLTLFQSKPLIPIVNYPIFMRMIEVLVRQGARNIIFSTKGIENSLRIKDVFRYGADFTARFSLKTRLNFMYQPNYHDKGSADSVRHAMEYYNVSDEVLVVSGDNIADLDLKSLTTFHHEKDALATVLLKELSPETDLSQFGVAELDENGRIQRFLEKPRRTGTKSRLINTAVYLFSPKILDILREMGDAARDIGTDLLPYLIENSYPVYGLKTEGYWADVGTPDNFLKTSLNIANQKVGNIRFRSEHEMKDHVWVHPTTQHRFKEGGPRLERSTIIGGDCDIHKTAIIENSSIGDNCIIGANVQIRNAVVMDFVNIEEGVKLNSCIIGRYATIGEKTAINAENIVEVSGRKDLTPVVGDNVTIVAHSILGAYNRVAPIEHSHTILKSKRFKALGYDESNFYFIEK